jgi:hypothetical protein
MMACGVVDVCIQVFLTPVLFRESLASEIELFTPGEICSYI